MWGNRSVSWGNEERESRGGRSWGREVMRRFVLPIPDDFPGVPVKFVIDF